MLHSEVNRIKKKSVFSIEAISFDTKREMEQQILSHKFLKRLGLHEIFDETCKIGTEGWFNQLRHISEHEYKKFKIVPPGKRARYIQAPISRMYIIQKEILEELSKLNLHHNVYGVKGNNFIKNAKRHEGAKAILKVDLDKFYPSCTLEQIQKNMKDKRARAIIEKYSIFLFWTEEDNTDPNKAFLPTGTPTSPMVANLALTSLDYKLEALTKECNGTYTRYLDDITFSFMYEVTDEGKFMFLKEVENMITAEGWKINTRKSKWINPENDQVVITGVDIRNKPKVTRRYVVEKLRPRINNEVFNIFKPMWPFDSCNNILDLNDILKRFSPNLRGELNYVRDVNTEQYEELIQYIFKRISRVEPNLTKDLDKNILELYKELEETICLMGINTFEDFDKIFKGHYNKTAENLPVEVRSVIALNKTLIKGLR